MPKRFALFISALLCAVTCGYAADASRYVSVGPDQIRSFMPNQTRTIIDLSGTWQVMRDGVPLSETFVPGALDASAPVIMRRTVRVEQGSLQRNTWHLQVLGVIDELEVRVNGRFVMRYPGGAVPFTIRIPDPILSAGTNTIEFVVSPTSELTARVEGFARASRKRSMGVIREVFLVGTPHVWTNDVRVRSSIEGATGKMKVNATVMGGAVERILGNGEQGDALAQGKVTVMVEATLSRRGAGVIARASMQQVPIERARQQTLTFDLAVAQPARWSINSPELYDLSINVQRDGVVLDVYTIPVGFRSANVVTTDRGRMIALNDTVLPIHAVDYIEDYPNRGISMSWKQMEQDVSIMKTLGVNVVRVHHGSPHPYFLSLCDRYGIMIMAELPVSDIPSDIITQQEMLARYKNSSERTIAYLDAHPSVLAIGLSDGLEEGSEAVSQFHADLVKIFRRASSKLLYKVVPSGLISRTSEGGFDLIVVSFLSSRDKVQFDERVYTLGKTFRSAAVVTLFGSRLSPDNTRGFSDPLSNEAQALVVRDRFRATMGAGLAGIIVWSFADYALERPTMLVDHYDAYVCTSGLLDVWRQPRISFAMLKSLINDEKEPLLQARDASFDTPLIFIATGILLALIIAFLINRSRRFREYLVRAVARPYNFYADIRDQRILSTIQTTVLGIVIASCVGLVLASLLYYVRVDPEIEYLLHIVIPSNSLYEMVRYVSWRPSVSVFAWSGAVMLGFLFAAVVLRAGAMFVKARIYFRDTLTIVIWSALPLVVLLPIGVALYQALSTHALSIWVPMLVVGLTLWSVMRTLRATSVVFDIPSGIVYSIGLGALALGLVVGLVTWNASYDAFSFVRFFYSVVSA